VQQRKIAKILLQYLYLNFSVNMKKQRRKFYCNIYILTFLSLAQVCFQNTAASLFRLLFL